MLKVERFLHQLSIAMAVIAGAMLAFIPCAVVVDVTIRATGGQPPQWTSAVVEYLNLYIAMLVAPWILTRKGHVVVEIILDRFKGTTRLVLDRLIVAICALLCLLLGALALQLLVDSFQSGAQDVRSIDLPRWLLFVPFVVSFFTMLGILVCVFIRGDTLMKSGHGSEDIGK
jgi:TRAP-type C4-dicarboxylate transport system permease small subunit